MKLFAKMKALFIGVEENAVPEVGNSPELIAKIHHLLVAIEANNAEIVGAGIYSTSGHNNQSLVYRAVAFAQYRLDEVLGSCDDNALIAKFITCINASKNEFEQNNYDPDGAGVGTLVDIVNGLKGLEEELNANGAEDEA
ncbi:hypothetical protein [Thalassomonas sp. RHCl1]|uniref:hypothetical protein n=1 Tax=Thalassomonas sp. RHCl1 TaxID=2995320 RepID=UPI00248ABC0E|nr:hypothetical protein [Thalassomonas sp. RHCl1]